MNIRYIHQVMMTYILLLLLFSCSHSRLTPSDTATVLSLSHTEVALDEMGQGTTIVEVRTNALAWEATTNASWLTAIRQGDELQLSAAPNTTGKHRQALVSVVAEAMVSTLMVAQSSGGVITYLQDDQLHVTYRGGTHLVAMAQPAPKSLSIEVDADGEWITAQPFDSFVSIDISPNDRYDSRVAKLFLKTPNGIEELVVEQRGRGSRFQVPMPSTTNDSYYTLINYETERYGNVMTHFSIGGQYRPDSYYFVCNSPLFISLEYRYHHRSKMFVYAIYTGTGIADELESDDFKQFLISEGFTISDEPNQGGESIIATRAVERGTFVATVTTGGVDQEDTSTFKVTFEEDEPTTFQTFPTFPYEKTEYLHNPTFDSQTIIAAEQSEGNTLVLEEKNPDFPDLIQKLAFSVSEKHRPATRREYNFNRGQKNSMTEDVIPSGEMEQLRVHFDRVELAYWLNSYGQYAMTKQFSALLDREGFVYYAQRNGMPYFYNPKRQLMVIPRVEYDTNNNTYLAINYYWADIQLEEQTSIAPTAYSFAATLR